MVSVEPAEWNLTEKGTSPISKRKEKSRHEKGKMVCDRATLGEKVGRGEGGGRGKWEESLKMDL